MPDRLQKETQPPVCDLCIPDQLKDLVNDNNADKGCCGVQHGTGHQNDKQIYTDTKKYDAQDYLMSEISEQCHLAYPLYIRNVRGDGIRCHISPFCDTEKYVTIPGRQPPALHYLYTF